MTRDDTKKLIMYLRMFYTDFCEGMNLTDVANVWHDIFRDEDGTIVAQAARNYVKTNKFPPTVAGIMEQLDLIKRTDTDADLWKMIQKAVSNGTYGAVEEFDNLPSECKAFIGSPSALRDMAQIDIGTMNTIVKGQFLKNVRAIRNHQQVQKGLPLEVKMAIEKAQSIANGDELLIGY